MRSLRPDDQLYIVLASCLDKSSVRHELAKEAALAAVNSNLLSHPPKLMLEATNFGGSIVPLVAGVCPTKAPPLLMLLPLSSINRVANHLV